MPSKNTLKFPLQVKDYAQSGTTFTLNFISEKAVLQTAPVPKDIAAYYSKENYISHAKTYKSFTEKLYGLAKKYQLKRKAQLLERHLKGSKKILDFGAGTGALVSYLKNKHWHALGVEPNQNARNFALENNCVLQPNLESIPRQQFNLISLWHVLEHTVDYQKTISNLLSYLLPGGAIVIAVPNFKSWDASHYQTHWAAFDVPRHLWHFSREAMAILAKEHGMVLEKIYPMPLDAFYVSLLSEQYKKKKMAFVRAFLKGLYSNISAIRTKEYSSLLYVLRKPA